MKLLLQLAAGAVLIGCVSRDAPPVEAQQAILAAASDRPAVDTVDIDEGCRLLLFGNDTTWPGSIDSVGFRVAGRTGGARLNKGGYQGAHTWLKWANGRYACFGFGCGSPCWGVQVVDLLNGRPPIERMYTILEDSASNVVCYVDSEFVDEHHATIVVEQFSTGLSHRATVELGLVAVPAASVDSAWRAGGSVCLRCTSDGRIQCFNVPWLNE